MAGGPTNFRTGRRTDHVTRGLRRPADVPLFPSLVRDGAVQAHDMDRMDSSSLTVFWETLTLQVGL